MDHKSTIALVCCLLIFSLYDSFVYPHTGVLDSHGCHEEEQQGNYHCHSGMFAGETFNSKTEMLFQPAAGKRPREGGAQYRIVKQVISGDTLIMANNERVHFIGVDAPDTRRSNKPGEHYGREAFAFTKWMAEGKRVRLEYDEANARFGHKDRYQQTLVYLFLENGTLLNAEIIKQGYGFANRGSPYKYLNKFNDYQQEAKVKGRGLWERFTTSHPTRKKAPATTSNLKKATRSPAFVIGIYRTRHSTFVYSQPGEYSNKVFELEKGTTVNVVAIYGDWLMIKSKHGKMPGYIRKRVLIP